MLTVIFILCILASLLLIGLVLIQPGKGDMMSGMGGINTQFNAAFGSTRASDLLTKSTWVMATAIIVLTLVANIFFTGGDNTNQNLAPTEKIDIPINVNQPAGIPSTAAPEESAVPSSEQAPAEEASEESEDK